MIKCPNCNSEVSDENIFCPSCGSRLSAPAPVQETQEPAPAVEAPAAEAPAAPAAEKPAKKGFDFAPILAALKKFWGKTKEVANKVLDKIPLPRKIVAIIGAALGVIIVGVIVLLIVLGANKDYPYALYVKDGDLYFSNLKAGKAVEIIDLSSDSNKAAYIGNSAVLTENGKRLFYPEYESDGTTTLYYRDLSKKNAVKVDTNVTKYAINANGTSVVYVKEGNLYKSNLKDKEKIASDISNFYVSEDLKKIMYSKENALYFKNGNKDAEKMVSDASMSAYDHEKLAWVFYAKEGSLYFQKTGKDDKVKVAGEYANFLTALEGGKAYFTKAATSTAKLWDFVDDDMAAADAAMTEPVYPTYPDSPDYPSSPWRSDYDTYEEYEAAYEEYQKEYNRLYEEYQAARDKYYEDQDKYYEDYSKWNEKCNRDGLRETLKETDYNQNAYELYYFDGKEAKLVVSGMNSSWDFDYEYDEEGNVQAYGQVVIRTSADVTKIRLSEVNYYWQVEEYLNSGSGDEVKKLVWQDKVFDVNVEKASTIRFSTDGKKVYILANVDGEKDTGDLYEAKFSKSGMGKAKEIDTDVSTYGWGFSKDVGVYYMKDYKKDTNKGDLYVKGKKIDFDVSSGGVAAFKGGYLYKSGDDMKYYKSGKAITVAEKVRSVALINSDTLVLLYDWNSEKGKGTLGVFTGGKKVTELDDDVTRLIAPNYSLIRTVY